jgi:hypothetical protein
MLRISTALAAVGAELAAELAADEGVVMAGKEPRQTED